jgi:PKD repeat protein
VGSAWATSTPGSGWNYDGATELSIQLIEAAVDVPWLSESPISSTIPTLGPLPLASGKAAHPAPSGQAAPNVPLTLSSPKGQPVVVPAQPAANPMAVLWDQPLSITNTNAYVDQEFTDFPDYSSFLADDFTNTEPWSIDTIFVPGDLWNGGSTLMNAVSLNFQIYADAGGRPAGDPWSGGAIWSLSVSPADAQIVLSNGSSGLASNTTLNLAAPVTLRPGHWWLVFYPVMSFGSGGQYGRQPSDTTNGGVGQFINPGGGFGFDGPIWQPWGVLGVAQQDIAFRLEGSVVSWPSQVVYVTFDAGVPEVTQPGKYFAQLKIKDNAPYLDSVVPVTMTVLPSSTWGKLDGTVTGLARCDAPGLPLDKAKVFVQSGTGMNWTLTTNPSGAYQVWLDQANSPLTATVGYAGYITQTVTGIVVTQQQTTTQNFNLRLDAPCASEAPPSFDVSLPSGTSLTRIMTLTNSGAGATTFNIGEMMTAGHGEWLYRSEKGVLLTNNMGKEALAYPSAYRWTPDQPSAALNILIYADDHVHTSPNTFLDRALQKLGLAYTAYYDGDWSDFESALTSGTWDLVLVGNDNYGPPSSTLTALNNYVNGGGKLAFHTWRVSYYPGNALWTTLGFSYVSNDTDPPAPVYWWAPSHPIFNTPESVPQFTSLTSGIYGIYGQYVEPLSGFQAVAGYTTPGPDPNQAAMIVGNNNRTVFKGFLDGQNSADLDGDSTLDGVELWENLIYGLASGFGVDVPWLSENPVTGTVSGDSVVPVNVTFTALPTMTSGIYTATLVVGTSDRGNPNINVPVTMTIVVPPVCSFTSSSPTNIGQTTYFTNTTTGDPPLQFRWDLGDGSPVSGVVSPTHQYAQVGLYTVVLTATNPWGQDVCSHVVSVEGPPVPGFTSNSPVFVGTQVVFTNTTIANPSVLTWVWNLGDGTISAAQTPPPHTYAAGTYTVTLTAVNAKGTAVYTGTVKVLLHYVYLPITIK